MNEQKKICITTDCACDLPPDWLKENNVDVVYFYITTDTGCFRDVDEITARNLFEYIGRKGTRCVSRAADAADFRSFFENKLRYYDTVIHISISSKISDGALNAAEGIRLLGENSHRVLLLDSLHLSTGMGHLVVRGVQMVEQGASAEAILEELTHMPERISTSFIAHNAEYMHRSGKISKPLAVLCRHFRIHPVFRIVQGEIRMGGIQIGDYPASIRRYIKKALRHPENICSDRVFITHAACLHTDLDTARSTVMQYADFQEITVTKASATISSNCGPRTVGVLFVRK